MPLTTVNPALLDTQAQYTGFKNRLINSGMVINQRATPITDGAYSVDRWDYTNSVASKGTVAQSSVAPTAFSNSLGFTSSSAYSVGASDYFGFRQKIEGFNFADMSWGTASAATITISFWVRSSLTGTFGGSVTNSAFNRSYPFSYTISAANTWEQKSITIPGDTTGTWVGATNGIGLALYFGFGAGSNFSGTAGSWASAGYVSATGATSVVGTNGATFYVTGVQLEKGSTATSFDYRPYGTELQLCQRYYERLVPSGGTGISLTFTGTIVPDRRSASYSFKVSKRAQPSMVLYGSGSTSGQVEVLATGGGGSNTNYSSIERNTEGFWVLVSGGSGTGLFAFYSPSYADIEL